MTSTVECFQNAAKCELQAAKSTDARSRTLLLAMAENWRTLGRYALGRAASVPADAPGKPKREPGRRKSRISPFL
jgi:hypothetical protein